MFLLLISESWRASGYGSHCNYRNRHWHKRRCKNYLWKTTENKQCKYIVTLLSASLKGLSTSDHLLERSLFVFQSILDKNIFPSHDYTVWKLLQLETHLNPVHLHMLKIMTNAKMTDNQTCWKINAQRFLFTLLRWAIQGNHYPLVFISRIIMKTIVYW